MASNFTNIDNEGFAKITLEEGNKLKGRVISLLKEATTEGTQEITIIASEPIFFKSKGILEPKHELEPWDDDTFNYFLEHLAYERVNSMRPSIKAGAGIGAMSGHMEINTKFFDTLMEEHEYSKDFAVTVKGKTLRIHAVSIYNGSGTYNKYKMCFTIRVVMNEIPDYTSLNLPTVFEKTTTLTSGLVLISGHTGSGKSTTIASLINAINKNPAIRRSILTIEDPVEYVHKSSQAMVLQRAIGINTANYTDATKDALRENVDTVVIGELREAEAMDNAIRLAEMGKLVFATVHCNGAEDAINRIVDEFPGEIQESVRSRLAEVVVGIMHQNLEVVRNEKTGKDEQIPCSSGFLIQDSNQKSILRKDYSRRGISKIINEESFGFSYTASYKELVSKGIILDTPQNKSKLIPK